MRQLGRGSVIVFGSMKKPRWVMDTVLVIRDYVDYTAENYEAILKSEVPQSLWNATMATYQNTDFGSTQRLYRGATYDEPIDGMFSFFPCLPAETGVPFARPHIELPEEYFNPNLSQEAKGCAVGASSLAKSTVRELWSCIARQIASQGLALGVMAKSPAIVDPAKDE